MSNDRDDLRQVVLPIALFAAIFVLIGWDLAADYGEGSDWAHLGLELFVLVAAAFGALVLWLRFRQARSDLVVLEQDLATAREQAERWRGESRDLLEGLGAAIERQFMRWQLTPAESEIGLLLLKGLSHKELAGLRDTSERTVREQARSLYRKAGLPGRASLSAFFLEDLLLPQHSADGAEAE
ncbi:MAG: LuxR family transcriptional regulator [Gammaproteobacteria bacterium]|nr:LuxR family transcriptional regulator [Gammaproteobacteria bacterium]MDH4253926.1 LuxR family transcriptional regulator [Gammaproteobacteria bacterium]MDH5309351.1 LuxR family transcriptional regulator [Gammaproteobacteria bacterium]